MGVPDNTGDLNMGPSRRILLADFQTSRDQNASETPLELHHILSTLNLVRYYQALCLKGFGVSGQELTDKRSATRHMAMHTGYPRQQLN